MDRSPFDRVALVIVIIGAINWLLIGLFNFDLVTAIFGGTLFAGVISFVSRIVFTIVGLAGLYTISLLFRERAPAEQQ